MRLTHVCFIIFYNPYKGQEGGDRRPGGIIAGCRMKSGSEKCEKWKSGARRPQDGFLTDQSVMASEGQASTQAPQSTHLSASTTATSSMVMAPFGQASAQAPHATQLSALTFAAISFTP